MKMGNPQEQQQKLGKSVFCSSCRFFADFGSTYESDLFGFLHFEGCVENSGCGVLLFLQWLAFLPPSRTLEKGLKQSRVGFCTENLIC
jgi:hypothetical protein